MRKVLHRAAGAGVLLAACSLLLSSGAIRSTFGIFNAETKNAGSAFAGGWVGAPSGLTATAQGTNMSLQWTPGTHGPVTGQRLYGYPNGTNSNCTGAPYNALTNNLTATSNSAVDATGGKGTTTSPTASSGDWVCYQVVSTSATVWTAQLSTAAQYGLVATAISTANAATKCSGATTPATGTIDCNDTIVITFNQKPVAPASTIAVCTWAGTGTTGSIVIGDTNTTACNASGDTFSIGRLSGFAIGTSIKYTSSTVAVSASAPWQMTITLGGVKTTSTTSGTATFTGSSGTVSSLTPATPLCSSTTATTCRPTATLTW